MKVWFGTFLVICLSILAQTEADPAPGSKATTCPCGVSKKGRIVGGKETNPNQYPWVAMLITSDNPLPLCGSSIVTEEVAITAVHCTREANGKPLSIIAGRNEVSYYRDGPGQIVSVKRYIEHEDYYTSTLDPAKTLHDIALLILSKPLEFNSNVGAICLPLGRMDLDKKWVKILGWGKLGGDLKRSMKLMEVDVKILPYSLCRDRQNLKKTQTQICYQTPNKNSCQGDSGGPVVYLDPDTNRYTLVGLMSFGDLKCTSSQPTVSAEVATYLPWIKSKIKTLGCQKVETKKERGKRLEKVKTMNKEAEEKAKEQTEKKKPTKGGNRLGFLPFVPRQNNNDKGAQKSPSKRQKSSRVSSSDDSLKMLLEMLKKQKQ